MDLGLKDRIVVVGGASQGIGYGIAETLVKEGAHVVITARGEESLIHATERLRAHGGGKVHYVAANVRRAEDSKRVAAEAIRVFGGIDILVNNDGAPPHGSIESFDDLAWDKAVEQNLSSVVRMVREVTPSMRARGGGSILNITALSAIQPMSGYALSVATWAAVIGFAKTLSIELGPSRINVNTLCPGYTDTERLQKFIDKGDEPPDVKRERLIAGTSLKRIGTVDDIASMVALLVSPRGSYVTGTTIPIDGGATRSLL
jgi:3-oxoacyl-[acyl-carrier protein] reductase